MDIVSSYENGYLKTYTDSYVGNDQYTTSSVTEYFWEDGNLIKTVETGTYKYVDGIREDEVSTTEKTYTYSDKLNPANVSFDLNANILFNDGSDRFFTESMGFLGKPTKNLISSSTYTYNNGGGTSTFVTEYDWELDSKGYITKLAQTDEYETRIITVTYKN